MKVYTHYKETSGRGQTIGIRFNTLLQFGDSWNVLGSVVMKNPGSANFKDKGRTAVSDPSILSHLEQFDNYPGNAWFEFNADTTMQCIQELFSVQPGELNGVILIFNLMYVRTPDVQEAIDLFNDVRFEDNDISTIREYAKLPIYLGWGNLGNDIRLTDKAHSIFSIALPENEYLKPAFEDNSFYHPQYLRRGKRFDAVKMIKASFKKELIEKSEIL